MPSHGYILAVLAIVFVITLALRAVPFAVLKPLRESRFVATMAIWMPAGILAILAASTFANTVTENPDYFVKAIIAVGVTAAVHLVLGRRTLLSVGLGTLTFVVFVNLV